VSNPYSKILLLLFIAAFGCKKEVIENISSKSIECNDAEYLENYRYLMLFNKEYVLRLRIDKTGRFIFKNRM
jgi:hypothetical protein